jgi:uncharacterized delta-60 repeat protein
MTGVRLVVLAALAAALLFVAGSAQAAPGTLDPSFGNAFLGDNAGWSITGTGLGGYASALLLQPDGKFVAVGARYDEEDLPGPGDIVLARYNPDGSPDPSFGSDGVVTTTVPGGPNASAAISAAALQPDGRIVVAGTYYNIDPGVEEFMLARYNPDGSLDTSFGNGGVVKTQVEDVNVGTQYPFSAASGVVLQPDGKIVAGGEVTAVGDGQTRPPAESALVRYLPDGSLDTTFGSGGIVLDRQSGQNGFSAIALQPDGKILAVGDGYGYSRPPTPLTRFNPDGTLDSSFGNGGESSAPTNQAIALALQPDGKIVVAGSKVIVDGSHYEFALARVNPDGSPDEGFGNGGALTTPLGSDYALATGVAVQPDGKLVAVGGSAADPGFVVVRYNPDGALDTSFGSGGVAVSGLPEATQGVGASAVVLQPDGKIVVGGEWESVGWAVSTGFALARFAVTNTLTVSTSGNGGGSVTSSPAGIDCRVTCSMLFAAAPITLTARAGAGSVFAGWSGACSGTGACTVTPNADRSVTADFELPKNMLRVARSGRGHGTVTSGPAGIRCGHACSHAYGYGTAVTLVARPAKGSAFRRWVGGCSSARKSCTLLMTKARSAKALFRLKLDCAVPKLAGESFRDSERRIRHAHCRTGTVKHRSSRAGKGTVISQSPRPGKRLRDQARINLVLSSGLRR